MAMKLEEIKSNLCYNDIRNPYSALTKEDMEEIAALNKECHCDNCFRGKTELAEELLRMYYIIHNPNGSCKNSL
jgi:hypothetical protein